MQWRRLGRFDARSGPVAAGLVALLVTAAGCGSSDSTATDPASTGDGELTVYAASSLGAVLPVVAPGARYTFGGSDQLAFQIREGAPADVYVSADPALVDTLHRDGLVAGPVVFALNTLVIVTPRGNPAGIDSPDDLARPGVRLVLGGESVPVGAYSRSALRALGLEAALANLVSNEDNVSGVVAKTALGEADAGIVYATDQRAAADRLRVVPIPARAQPRVAYSVAVVTGSRRPAAARDLVRRLTGPEGRAALVRAGFRVPSG